MRISRWMVAGLVLLLIVGIGMAARQRIVSDNLRGEEESDYGLILADSSDYVYVLAVMENSTASSAGVEPGDVVTDFDGVPTKSLITFHRLMKEAKGDSELKLQRRGVPLTVRLRND